MQGFEILFHGQFAESFAIPGSANSNCAGFYTSRVIDSANMTEAIVRGKELIREELDKTFLSSNQEMLVSLDAEEVHRVEIDENMQINRPGFTFYTNDP